MERVIDYATFKEVHLPPDEPVKTEAVDEEEPSSENSDSDDDSDAESDAETESGSDADSNGDLRDFIVHDIELDDVETEDEDNDDPVSDGDGDDEAEVLPQRSAKSKGKMKEVKRRPEIKHAKRQGKGNGKGKGKGKAKFKSKKQTVSIAVLKKDASRSAKGRRRYLKFLKKHWQPSAKVTKCVELLDQFQNDGQKTIVFSQFVSLLDLLQVPIDEKEWVCERYDGSMNAEKRNNAIIRFTDRADTNIMLISLKAGNAGLNLVGASRVIILDPFWNPYIEMQAIDRAYRIGQQRPVEVHRILIKNTVEDRIIELQEQKKKLVEAALDEGASKSVSRLGNKELAFLFGVGGA
jgi:SNF2 family DNA or RNA helicase